MISKPLEAIDQHDLKALVDNQVHEGEKIEYKRDLFGSSDSERKEFLKDVSSFANTAGGDLLIGVESKDGLPIRYPGVVVSNEDNRNRGQTTIFGPLENVVCPSYWLGVNVPTHFHVLSCTRHGCEGEPR